MKILIVSSEVAPFSKTGGLADVAGALPRALKKAFGHEVRVVSPLYKMVRDKDFKIDKIRRIKSIAGFKNTSFDLFETKVGDIVFYFIGKDEYFNRENLYGFPQADYEDNAKRFSFFCRAVLAAAIDIGFYPDIIHANDWQTGLLPLYRDANLKKGHPLRRSKILFTVHNLAYQGNFVKDMVEEIDLPEGPLKSITSGGDISFIKSGIIYSDAISTVSKKYADEILTPEYGCGLDNILRKRKGDLYGILNGADYSNWNPETDKLIPENYGVNTLEKKLMCKDKLLKQMKLTLPVTAPLLGSIGRLAEQKGIDIIIDSIGEIIEQGSGFVLLGTGDEIYESALKKIAGKKIGKLGISIAFDNKLAHAIEAGVDMFVMPSRYEPCGLNQMYSLKYGTIPIVRATGGLDDTIIDYNKDPIRANGFKFERAQKPDFIEAVKRAIKVFSNKEEWKKLQRRAMKLDFSWKRTAREYTALYEKMTK